MRTLARPELPPPRRRVPRDGDGDDNSPWSIRLFFRHESGGWLETMWFLATPAWQRPKQFEEMLLGRRKLLSDGLVITKARVPWQEEWIEFTPPLGKIKS